MKKSLFALSLVLGMANVASASIYEQEVRQGQSNNVQYSVLTTGSQNNGSNPVNKWYIDGTIFMDHDSVGGSESNGSTTLVNGPYLLNIRNSVGGTILGSLSITGFYLEDADRDNNLLGYALISITSNGTNAALTSAASAAPSARVDFKDKEYGSSGSAFNGFSVTGNTLTTSLWGNETVMGSTGTSVNWGLDWRSDGQIVVPEPGTMALLAIGGLVSIRRKR